MFVWHLHIADTVTENVKLILCVYFSFSFKVCSALKSVWVDTESCLSVLKRTWPSTYSLLQRGSQACWRSLKSSSLESDLHSLASNLVWGCGGVNQILPYVFSSAWGHFHYIKTQEKFCLVQQRHQWHEMKAYFACDALINWIVCATTIKEISKAVITIIQMLWCF